MKYLAVLYYFRKAIIFCLISIILNSCTTIVQKRAKEGDGVREALERDFKMMKDPALGYVPTNRLIEAKRHRDQLWQSQTNAAISGVNWNALGPKNQGGRTRAMLIDANDPTGNTIWAGSVGGGLWKTTDITATEPNWVAVNDFFDNLAITSIAQDPNNTQVMYFCTGEGYGNFDLIQGMGVWKTTDGGGTWFQIASTNISNFYYCQKVVVNSTGIVFVATLFAGLQRSTNGGTTWTKVLGTGLGITGATSDICWDVDLAANGDIYASLVGSVHKSTSAGITFAAAQTLPITAFRTELACAPNDANYVYALVEDGGVVNGIIKTTNGGTLWTSGTEPVDGDPSIPATDFSRGQAWYDLAIAVDPNNKDVLFVGGIDLFKSIDGAASWTQISHWYGAFALYAHEDQQNIIFKPGSSSIAYFINDAGVYLTDNATSIAPILNYKGHNYITAQFYACALHPTAFTNYCIAGTQDNGTHQFSTTGLQNTLKVLSGDGGFCHIDQNQPQYQFGSYQFGDNFRSIDGGTTWSNIASPGGQFINPTDYDDTNNLMYCARYSNEYLRWDNPQTGSTFTTIPVASFGGQVSAIKVSPNTNHRVFFGLYNGDVFRVDNANTASPTATNISTGLPNASLSCIEVETGNDNHLIATYSNYGVNSIWESINGGSSWTSVEGNMPDMPIRWALFNPNNSDQVILATELGVWSTDNLNGGATVWGVSNSGLANVRVDMLQLRTSDNFIIAATHGRGMFSSDAFTSPTAMFTADKVTTYQGIPVNFTSNSYKATSWTWNFGDAGTSTSQNPSHTYAAAGKYNVTLTINSGVSTITKTAYIHILPNRGTPYTLVQGGNFESNANDFGSMSTRGSTDKWERGVPSNFLTTVNSPVNAWKTDLDADLTAGNYACSFMSPNYNFTAPAGSGYQLRFRSSMEVVFCSAPFAVQCQYSTNKGVSWIRLGTGANPDPLGTNWYNRGPAFGCFINAAIFSDRIGWTLTTNNSLCTYDVSFLAGNTNVAFRFVLSVASGYSPAGYAADGFMIDDFEIFGPFNATLAVNLNAFAANQKRNDALLNWLTSNEVNIKNYTVERSYDAINFLPVTTVAALNSTSNNYSFTDRDAIINAWAAKYLYYRLKITDNTGKYNYSEIARITLGKSPKVTLGPSPFVDYVSVYSNDAIKNISVYTLEGKLIYVTSNVIGNKILLDKKMAPGMYVFKIETSSGIITRKMLKVD